MEPLDRLIRLFSVHEISDILANDGQLLVDTFNVTDYTKLPEIPGYENAYVLVRKMVTQLDQVVKDFQEPSQQVNECLRILLKMMDDMIPTGNIDVMQRLIEGRLYGLKWDDKGKQAYDRKREILKWKDFFISYSNRDAPATNQEFRMVIRSSLGKNPKDGEESNYLAKVLAKHLRTHNLEGFFDEWNLKVGEDIKEEITEYCKKCFGFVQLIEPVLFRKDPEKENWCHFEYNHFTENPALQVIGNLDRHYFVTTQEQLDRMLPVRFPSEYENWRDNIARRKRLCLVNKRETALRLEMREIAAKIRKLREETIEAWLSQ